MRVISQNEERMSRMEIPANIWLMDTSPAKMERLKVISSLDVFESGSSQNYHPQGLFSTEIFGRVGTLERDVRYGRIDLKLPVIHPFIFKKITKLRGLYKDIIQGKGYATFNSQTKDFEPADIIGGQTGYAFFLQHLPQLEFKLTESAKREIDVDLVNKARNEGTMFVYSVPVIPAGLRDVYIEPDGRISEDEVNTKYRSLISSVNTLPSNADALSDAFNTTRVTMQNALVAIFEYLWDYYEGKRGFALKRVFSRGVYNGTRNVISAQDPITPYLGAPNGPKMNNTVVGLYQTMKALLPVAQHLLLNGWIKEAFNSADGRAYLTNKKTYKSELVNLPRKVFDRWTTPEGIEKIINYYYNREIRHRPVEIGDYYIGLVYRGEFEGKDVFKFFKDIEELPREFDKSFVFPISLVELMYLSGYREWNNYPMMNTRYPVAGLGSTYISNFYVKTTSEGEMRYELDDEWKIKKFNDGNDIIAAYEYPKHSVDKFFETAAISVSRIGGAAADFDGDK